MTTERRTLDVVEAGKMLGLGRSAAYAAAARGEIPTLKFGRKIVVPIAQLEQLLRGDA